VLAISVAVATVLAVVYLHAAARVTANAGGMPVMEIAIGFLSPAGRGIAACKRKNSRCNPLAFGVEPWVESERVLPPPDRTQTTTVSQRGNV